MTHREFLHSAKAALAVAKTLTLPPEVKRAEILSISETFYHWIHWEPWPDVYGSYEDEIHSFILHLQKLIPIAEELVKLHENVTIEKLY